MCDLSFNWKTTESLRIVENILIAVSGLSQDGLREVVKWSLKRHRPNKRHRPETFHFFTEKVLPVKNASNHVAVAGK